MDSDHCESSVESSLSFIGNTFAGLAISKPITEHEDDCQLSAPVMCHEDRLAVEMLTSMSSENSGKLSVEFAELEIQVNLGFNASCC